ncbi:MAG: DUF2909 domain-containing protein [Pseudomonadota bacterium]|nr:DUF2909 domain-containing protein [Pseudomonadota bacterium]
MLVVIFLVFLLIMMLIALFRALMMMLYPPKDPHAMVQSLTWRIGLSLFVFACLMLGWYVGLWMPHGLAR